MGWGSFLTNLYNGKLRTHTDGRKWKYNSSKGVWKAETNETITQGNTGPTGPQGPMGPTGSAGIGLSTNGSNSNRVESPNGTDVISVNNDGRIGFMTNDPLGGFTDSFKAVCKHHSGGYMVMSGGSHYHYDGVVCSQGTYIRRVMLLFSLDNTNEGSGPRRMVNGRFTKFRSNGCCSQRDNILDLQCHKNYASTDLHYAINHQNNIPLITCNYNSEKFAAINLNYGLPHGCEVLFEGFFSDADVFGTQISYYDVRGTVLNSEIYNSITTIS